MPAHRRNHIGVDFTAVEQSDLAEVAVVAQCLDNQWVPPTLLGRAAAAAAGVAAVERDRTAAVRAEYLRALLNAEQVIVNRSFFYNSPVVYRDFQQRGSTDYRHVRDLLAEHILVPYLYDEAGPLQEPAHTTREFERWAELVADTADLTCLRLSWDDDANRTRTETDLVTRFWDFMLTLISRPSSGFARHLGLDPGRVEAFAQRLREVNHWAAGHRFPTREMFYREFVARSGTAPADSLYDDGSEKPFALELKQLVDLRHNTLLPDALDRLSLRPVGGLHRSALLEWQLRARNEPLDTTAMLDTLLRRHVFDAYSEVLDVALIGDLDLTDVVTARESTQWRTYQDTLLALLDARADFDERGRALAADYGALLRRITQTRADRRRERARAVIGIVVDVAGKVFRYELGRRGGPVGEWGEVADEVATRAVNGTVRLVVDYVYERVADRRAWNQHTLAVDLLTFRAENAGQAVAQIRDALHRHLGGTTTELTANPLASGGIEEDDDDD